MYAMCGLTRSGSRATLTPRIRASPEVGGRTPARIRSVVVFPAPSGPTIPKSSPAWTSKLRASTATWSPKRRVRRSTVSAGSAPPPPAAPAVPESVRRAASSTISVALDHQAHVGGDPRLEVEVRVAGDRDLDGVDELGPFLLRLDVPWRELGLARDVDDPAVVLAVAERVGADPRRLADPDAADPVLSDVDPAPAVAGVHERHDRAPGRDGLARLAVSDRDEPGEGRADLGVRERGGDLFDRGPGLPDGRALGVDPFGAGPAADELE